MKKILLLLGLLPAFVFGQNGVTGIPLPAAYSTAFKTTLAIDNANNKWIASSNMGIAMYNGSTWTIYNNSSGLPSNNVTSFAFSSNSNTWAGTYNGAALFNGSTWTSYQASNSGLASDTVLSVAVHNSDTWFGTTQGLSKFDGTNWTTYTTANSGLPVNYINSVAVDQSGVVWTGTKNGGMVQYNGTTWSVFNTSNTSLPSNNVRQVFVDNTGGIWCGSGPSPSSQNVRKFNGANFESALQLFPSLATINPNPIPSYGQIGTGPHGRPVFGCIGYMEITSPLSFYAIGYGILKGVSDNSTTRMWFVRSNASYPDLYVFDPAQHNSFGLLTPNNVKHLDVNEVDAAMMNRGDMHWNTITTQYEVPKGGDAHAIFASALWIGGLDAGGNLHQAAMTYRQSGMDYFPGPLDTTNGTSDSLVAGAYDHIWKIDKTKILEFQYYWSTGDVQNGNYIPNDDFLSWPAHGAGNQMHNLAPYVDVNSNGIYDPLTGGDYPEIKGDQMLYWIFNDNVSAHMETGGTPLKVEVHASAYAYNCPVIADSEKVVNYTTYYNFKIYNWSGQQYHDAFIGLWQDNDLGAYDDDFVGCYPPANIAFAYNGDQNDGSGPTPVFGTYGAHPPISSIVMLDGPAAEPADGRDNDNDGTIDETGEHNMLTGFNTSDNNFTVTGNPEHADDYYNYMTGKWKDSTIMTYGGNGYGGIIPTPFMFSSLPYDASGWSEPTAGNTPHDRRFVASCGPFNLNLVTPVSIDYAIVYTRDTTVGAYDSAHFALVLRDAAKVRSWYAAQSTPSCAEWNVGIQEVSAASLLSVYPNPASTFLTMTYHPVSDHSQFELLDLTGRIVQSGFVNAAGQTTISIADLPIGIYAIRVIDDGRSTAVKFIRQ
ncbi:MAG: T9SS type A sorting domain-containing protein [Bacteroidota bacterium]|nr:T9SS type A sorting domain-containing protein [Bacteroidota bacterium]